MLLNLKSCYYTTTRRRMFNKKTDNIKEIINQLNNQDAIIVVEGKKDKRALEKLGIDSKIFLLNCDKKSLIETSETLAQKSRQVILMLDSDPKGLELTKKMKNHLQSQGVHVNTKIGKTLLRLANSQVVESLDNIFLK
jgi:5S rRNA maturation endonuclease (ribonuclease M5)